MDTRITKIYDLKTLGFEKVQRELEAINKLFGEIKKNKQSINAKMLTATEQKEIAQLKKELQELKVKEQELKTEQQKKIAQTKELLAIQQREIAQAKLLQEQKKQELLEIKANKEAEALAAQKTRNEIQKLNLERKKEQQEARAARAATKPLEGTYNELLAKYRELSNFVKNNISLSNTQEIDKAKAELRSLKSVLDDFNRSLTKDNLLVGEYTSGIIQAFQKLGLDDVINDQVNRAKQALTALDNKFNELKQELSSIKVAGDGTFHTIEKAMLDNRREAERLRKEIEQVETSMKGMGTIGQQISASIASGFKNLRGDITRYFLQYLSFQQAVAATRFTLRVGHDTSDQLTKLQIVLQTTGESIARINKEIRDIETRTSLAELLDFAIIAAKAGVAEEKLSGVVKAIDEIWLVAGKELGTDVDTTVTNIVKLINIFGEGNVNEDSVRRFGNALVDLANKGVSTGEYLVNFANRMSGVSGITETTIQHVLGLAAAFQEQGVSAEVAGTAVTQLILRMGQDVPKYARLAGMSLSEFSDLLENRTGEALLALISNLNKTTGSFEQIMSLVPDLDIDGVRLASAFGTMAGNLDFFNEKIDIASNAIQNVTQITDAAALRQDNFAAKIDKVRKDFELLASNRAVLTLMSGIASVIGLVTGNIGILIGVLSIYATAWVVANAALIRYRATKIATNAVDTAHYALLVAQETITKAYAASLNLVTGATSRSTAATILWGIALKGLGIGALLVLLSIFAASCKSAAAAIEGETEALRSQARQKLINSQISEKVIKEIGEEKSKIEALKRVVEDTNVSYDTRRQALDKLIEINPAFQAALEGEIINIDKLGDTYKKVTDLIEANTRAKAANMLSSEQEQRLLRITMLRQKMESALAGKEAAHMAFSEEERELLPFKGQITLTIPGTDWTESLVTWEAVEELKKLEQKETEALKDYMNIAKENQKNLIELKKQQQKALEDTIREQQTSDSITIGERIKFLEAEIKRLEAAYDRLSVTDKRGQEDNLKQQKAYQEELNRLNDQKQRRLKETKISGSKISGYDKDALRDIDAETNMLIAELTERKVKGEVIESEYWNELYQITSNGIKRKLEILKGSNAAERKMIADLNVELIEMERKTNEELFKIGEKEAQDKLRHAIRAAEIEKDRVINDTAATEIEKAQARIDEQNTILRAYEEFSNEMDALEDQYNLRSKKNAQDRSDNILKTEVNLRNSILDLYDAFYRDMQRKFEREHNREEERYYRELEELYNNSPNRRKAAQEEEKIEREHRLRVLEIRAASLALENQLNESAYQSGIISLLEYKSRKESIEAEMAKNSAYYAKESSNAIISVWDNISSKIDDATDFANRLYRSVYQPMFDLQRQEISNELEAQKTTLEKEKQKRLERATTKEEEERIEAEYEAKMAELEKRAAERKKDIALKQLAIESAIAAFRAFSEGMKQGGLPLALTYSAMALAEYATKRSLIQAQTFRRGGKLGDVLEKGGVFEGYSHEMGGIPFMFKGNAVEVEGNEGYVINKKSMASNQTLSVSGTPAQIASAANVFGGGDDFMPGWRRIMAPDYAFPPQLVAEYYFNKGVDFTAIAEAINNRIDRIEVVLNPNLITEYRKKIIKNVNASSI